MMAAENPVIICHFRGQNTQAIASGVRKQPYQPQQRRLQEGFDAFHEFVTEDGGAH
jgi:hypothetical protein